MKGLAKDFLPSEQIEKYYRESLVVSATVDIPATPDEVWAVLGDNDLLRQKLKMGQVRFETIPLERGGSLLKGIQSIGGRPIEFIEQPYDWEIYRFNFGSRIFPKGMVRYGAVHMEMQPLQDGLIRVEVKLIMKPVWWARWLIKKLMQKTVQSFLDIFPTLVARAKGPIEPRLKASMEEQSSYQLDDSTLLKWRELDALPTCRDAILDFVQRMRPARLSRIRPFEVADLYGVDRMKTLECFLTASKAKFFDMYWDLLCPNCRGAKRRVARLSDITRDAHCDACGIYYQVLRAEDVELTFSPTPMLRPIDSRIVYCIGNPARAPLVHAQLTLKPQGEFKKNLLLPGRTYRIRSSLHGIIGQFQMDATNGLSEVSLSTEQLRAGVKLKVAPSFTLHYRNEEDDWDVWRLDCLDIYEKAATADVVSSLPSYRDLFGDDALRAGMDLGVKHLVILFSDLKDSTRTYAQLGDSRAFKAVQEHFLTVGRCIEESGGTVVKTMGDAVMAVFRGEREAIEAAIAIQKSYAANQIQVGGNALAVKLGLNAGPCIMVNLNDRIDYFGTTINICARLENESQGHDIVLAPGLYEHPDVKSYLQEQGFPVTIETSRLKGIDGEQSFYRVQLDKARVRQAS